MRESTLSRKITSLSNASLKNIRLLLTHRKHRTKQGLFAAEGLKIAKDAYAAGWHIKNLLFSSDTARDQALSAFLQQVNAQGGESLEVPRKILIKLTHRKNPHTVLGIFRKIDRDLTMATPRSGQIWVCLEQIRDPGNLGTILRTADCCGVQGVILIGSCCDPFSFEAVRASMGSVFHVPFYHSTEKSFYQWTRSLAPPPYALGAHLKAKQVYTQIKAPCDQPLFLVMGNEQAGLSPELTAWCQKTVRIPQKGQADSLNLSVATGVLLYHFSSFDT